MEGGQPRGADRRDPRGGARAHEAGGCPAADNPEVPVRKSCQEDTLICRRSATKRRDQSMGGRVLRSLGQGFDEGPEFALVAIARSPRRRHVAGG